MAKVPEEVTVSVSCKIHKKVTTSRNCDVFKNVYPKGQNRGLANM